MVGFGRVCKSFTLFQKNIATMAGDGGMGSSVFNGERGPVREDEKVLEMDGGNGCTTV